MITHELLRSWSPCKEGYQRFCELFPNGATLQDAIDGLVSDGHDDWGWWLFNACRNAGLFQEITGRGYRNSGYRNSGYRNSGDGNSGDGNSGDRNSGHGNSGHGNSGDGNSGDGNSGDGNSGGWNSGDGNSGDGNSGDRNSGDGNSGGWNSGHGNSGYFNPDSPSVVRVFGQDCRTDLWDSAYKPMFLRFSMRGWVGSDEMTDEEKLDNPLHTITGGILRVYGYKEAFQRSWEKADHVDRIRVKDLPNFDAEIFYQISGIDLREGK